MSNAQQTAEQRGFRAVLSVSKAQAPSSQRSLGPGGGGGGAGEGRAVQVPSPL